ncbi:MAG: DnaJ C-terminal domain-containing protein, partial [Candidatus Moraniibacteriota bacterium]
LSIPPGIENGQTLVVEGHGEAGLRGSRAGDLFVMVRVLPHAEFRREGRNILSKKSISYVIATLGGKIPVATIDGEVTIKVPAGTQPGEVFRIRGKGIRLGHFDEGDHLVEFTVRVPKNISSEERKLLEQLEKLQKGRA